MRTHHVVLQRVALFLHDQRSQLALESDAVDLVVAEIRAHAVQLFFNFLRLVIGHDQLVEVEADARESQPGGQLGQLHMHTTILVSAAYGLGRARQGAIETVDLDQQVGQVFDELFFVLQRLHIFHGDAHGRVDRGILGALKRVDRIAQIGGDGLASQIDGLTSFYTRLDLWEAVHQRHFAGERALEERAGGHQAVDFQCTLRSL